MPEVIQIWASASVKVHNKYQNGENLSDFDYGMVVNLNILNIAFLGFLVSRVYTEKCNNIH